MQAAIVSTANSAFPPFPGFRSFSQRRRFSLPTRKMWSSSFGARRIVCACSLPPRKWGDDLSSIEINDLSVLEHSSSGREFEDDSNVLIECRDVHKSFGEKRILKGLSFKIRHGEAVGIIGPSGSGKSTVLKIMAGLLAPDKGEVFICGRKRQGLISDEEMSSLRIGLVFQSAALFDSLTVRENVGFHLYEKSSMSDDQIAELVSNILAAVGLKGAEDQLPSQLSGGMKKRVALARAIIFDPTADTIEPEVCSRQITDSWNFLLLPRAIQ
ncbi:hypothetical protein AAC387_Pa12g1257 [Persea americana]